MGKEPNTVKSNLVSKLLDISEQDPEIEFEQSDFEDNLDSTVLVRERAARGSKLQSTFEKKSGKKIGESAHTITLLPESSKGPKINTERDVASLTKNQKDVIEKMHKEKKVRKEPSTCSESSQEHPR